MRGAWRRHRQPAARRRRPAHQRHRYAPSATIVALRVADWDEKTQGEILSHADEAIRNAADKGIKIVSRSLVDGSAGWTSATERLATTGGLLVNSTGNFGGAGPYNAQ